MNLVLAFQSNDFASISMLIILVIMNIVTWSIITLCTIRLCKVKSGNAAAKKLVLVSFTLNEAVQKVKSVDSPMGCLTEEAVEMHQNYRQNDAKPLANALPLNEYLVTQIRNSTSQIMRQLGGGITPLASIDAAAPFIGLFGTVQDIHYALINISQSGQMSIAVVVDPVDEALASTAAGLFVATPAVLVHNFFSRGAKTLPQDTDTYAHDPYIRLLNQKD